MDFNHVRKSSRDRIVAGVCGGLGENSPFPAWMWRVTFVMLTLVGGFGLLFYLVLWIFMPNAVIPPPSDASHDIGTRSQPDR